jgi:asparagine synthase (glutamine-hydrolysing)
MCGIAGILDFRGVPVEGVSVRGMIDAIRHRGPDDIGIYNRGQIGLGHARLSIIDLAGGHQPMHNQDRSLWITFNGEIFNYIELREELVKKGHRFLTSSDTEVILHLYEEEGDACVTRLNGQWAFAIWDENRRRLFLSRDRLGVRPLFYTEGAGRFWFASEIKALLACSEVDCELDLHSLDQIFTFWVTLPPYTAFKNIRQLPPGHSMVVQDGLARVSPYWQLDYAMEPAVECEKQLCEELLALLQDATRIRLRSDVPVGAYLSGGLDSTVIASLTGSTVGNRLRTFSVSFEDAEFDESSYQVEASKFLRTQHSDIRCSGEDIAAVFPDVVWHAEQPIVRTAPAPLYLLSRLVRDSGFKVVLTGEGADETMGGYDIFKEVKIRSFWGRNPASNRRALLLKRLYPYMDQIQRQPRSYLERFFRVSDQDLGSPFFSHLPRWDLTAKLKSCLSDAARSATESYSAKGQLQGVLPAAYERWSPFNKAEYLETRYLLPGYILSSQGDRMAMAHGVEGRYPFLDHRLVEFAAKLPPNLKMKVLDQKHLLKEAARGLIPERIRKRYKQPYRAPDGKSFFGSAGTYVDDLLCPEMVRRYGIFDPAAVMTLMQKFKSGRPNGAKDNMAFVGILSTQLLIDRFIHQREARRGSQIGRELDECDARIAVHQQFSTDYMSE